MRFRVGGRRFGLFGKGINVDLSSRRLHARDYTSPHPRVDGYVYIIERDGDRRIKIGSSRNPSRRLAELQTGSADLLRIVYTHPVCGNYYAVEIAAHDILDRYRGLGEWFDTPVDVAVGVINTAAWRYGSKNDAEPNDGSSSFGKLSAIILDRYGAIIAAIIIAIALLNMH